MTSFSTTTFVASGTASATAIVSVRVCALALVLLLAPAIVRADIYKCLDAEGLVTFTDSPSRKFKTCTLLYRDPTPAPAAKPATPAGGAAGTGAGSAAPRSKSEVAAVRANPGPENFPRVERGEQRERDMKARQIVERELVNEQRALEEVRRQMAALSSTPGADKADPRFRDWQGAAQRHERNITEIQRQLSLMK